MAVSALKKGDLRPGTVFLVPVNNAKWACGVVTHVGKHPIVLAALSLKECHGDEPPDTLVRQVLNGPRWRTRMGDRGFTDGWKIVGHTSLPVQLVPLPPVYVSPTQGVVLGSDLLTPIATIEIAPDTEVLEDGAPDYGFIEEYLAMHLVSI